MKKLTPHLCKHFLSLAVLLTFLSITGFSQELPKKIRGYKVHKANITVQNKPSDKESKFSVKLKFGDPKLSDIGLRGITLELPVELKVLGKSGEIHFLTFEDFKVDGIKVKINEHRESIKFRKNEVIKLGKPVEIFVGFGQTIRGAYKEVKNSKKLWVVTGRVYVFGKFRKFGLKFKRVVPVKIELGIDNPLLKLR